MSPSKHILVVGAGIAGPVVSFWLGKAGFKVTVVERSSKLYKAGQGVDLEGPAREIIRKMGLEETIKKRTTGEEGFMLLDDDGKPIESIDGGLTRSIEIMRGDLAEILVEAAERFDGVTMRYGVTCEELEQNDDGVTVTFSDGTSITYDAVVGADGMRSKTRELCLEAEDKSDCFIAKDHYIAYFTVPREPQDGSHARWQNSTEGRAVLVRPVNHKRSSAYVNIVEPSDKLEAAIGDDKQVQKSAIVELFSDVAGEAPRVIRQMMESQDFYFERIAQVKLTTWCRGRCVLVGDAAYAPSPITGEGTNLAVTGAFFLAGEFSQLPNNPGAAFKEFERKMRPFVEKAQVIPLGGYAPRLANPETAWGVWLFRTIFKVMAKASIWKAVDPGEPEIVDLPEYPAMEGK